MWYKLFCIHEVTEKTGHKPRPRRTALMLKFGHSRLMALGDFKRTWRDDKTTCGVFHWSVKNHRTFRSVSMSKFLWILKDMTQPTLIWVELVSIFSFCWFKEIQIWFLWKQYRIAEDKHCQSAFPTLYKSTFS